MFAGYSYVRWFIDSASFLFSFSFMLNPQYANKHSNRNESPPNFAELHRENYIWRRSWLSYTGDKNHWSGQVWYKYVGTTTKAGDLSYFVTSNVLFNFLERIYTWHASPALMQFSTLLKARSFAAFLKRKLPRRCRTSSTLPRASASGSIRA